MRALAAALLLALATVPALPAQAAPLCTPPVSQWGACVRDGCVIVDGPMLHAEQCLGVVALPAICTAELGQWGACVDWPCVTADGPMLHAGYCVGPA